MLRRAHSNAVIASASSAHPWAPHRYLTPSHVFTDGLANRFDSACWPVESTLTVKCEACSKAARRLERVDKQNSTSGGSSDTEVNEFTVTPVWPPAAVQAVAIMTAGLDCPEGSTMARTSRPSPFMSGSVFGLFLRLFGPV